MISYHRAPLVNALAFALLLGCGSSGQVAAQATARPTPPTPLSISQPAERPPATAIAPAAAAPASPAAVAAQPAPASSPRVAASPRAQLGPGTPNLDLQLVTSALRQPVDVTHAGDGSARLFVVEKQGRIVIVRNGAPLATPFLDITSLVGSSGSEQGLLGLAFHPRYAENGRFYVNYTDVNGNTVVAGYQALAENPDLADPNSTVTLLGIEQPAANHNGGNLMFGPDGYLYIGTGDGGRAGDPWGNAQNRSVLLGKLLRLDVDSGVPYGIPPDNPFVNEPGARPEVWAYGLRNPWRYSFDRATGDLYIADVGQNQWEWVHLQRAGTGAGQNYGWNLVEGSHCYPANRACDPAGFVQPIAEYDHSLGCSITGGYVYRGPSFPQLSGIYFFGDYCSGRIWGLQEQAPGAWQQQELRKTPLRISSFGEDEAGELYLTSLSDGGLYRLVPAP